MRISVVELTRGIPVAVGISRTLRPPPSEANPAVGWPGQNPRSSRADELLRGFSPSSTPLVKKKPANRTAPPLLNGRALAALGNAHVGEPRGPQPLRQCR